MKDITPYLIENVDHHVFRFDYDVHIDVKIAWGMYGAEGEMSLCLLEHALKEPIWQGKTALEAGLEFPHWDLVLSADLSCPIIVTMEPGCTDLTVVDGRHRLLKAWLLGEKMIATKFIPYGRLLDVAGIDQPMGLELK